MLVAVQKNKRRTFFPSYHHMLELANTSTDTYTSHLRKQATKMLVIKRNRQQNHIKAIATSLSTLLYFYSHYYPRGMPPDNPLGKSTVALGKPSMAKPVSSYK